MDVIEFINNLVENGVLAELAQDLPGSKGNITYYFTWKYQRKMSFGKMRNIATGHRMSFYCNPHHEDVKFIDVPKKLSNKIMINCGDRTEWITSDSLSRLRLYKVIEQVM